MADRHTWYDVVAGMSLATSVAAVVVMAMVLLQYRDLASALRTSDEDRQALRQQNVALLQLVQARNMPAAPGPLPYPLQPAVVEQAPARRSAEKEQPVARTDVPENGKFTLFKDEQANPPDNGKFKLLTDK